MGDEQDLGHKDDAVHLVVLVHGIRTHAAWYVRVGDVLRGEGFKVELSNYGRFGILRFLLPVPFFKAWASADIERDIRAAMQKHNVKELSVIAHSFGTYVIGHILRKKFDIIFRHIIFCGSVVKFRFPFEQLSNRFTNVVNEVGTRDIWPILAESVTWGYGSAGAFGFKRAYVFDRYHRGLSHSAFLNAPFCQRWWIPVLRGEEPVSADEPEDPPWWLRILSIIPVKYIVLALAAVWTSFIWCRAPAEIVDIPQTDVYPLGVIVDRLVAQAEQQPCNGWCPEFMQCRKCMQTTGMENAAKDLWLCRTKNVYFQYRDPATALEKLESELNACLEIGGISERRLRVGINRTRASPVNAGGGKTLWLCGCSPEGIKKVLETVTDGR